MNDNGMEGFIDKTGKLVIPCQWAGVSSFHDGLALVGGYYKDGYEDKDGYIDKTGKLVIPVDWSNARPYSEGKSFSEGLAAVQGRGKWGFIDTTGTLVIPCQFKDADSFNEGLACVITDDNKAGYIDKNGKMVITLDEQWVLTIYSSFSDGLAVVYNKELKKYGYINKSGILVIPFGWNDARPFSEGLAHVSNYDKTNTGFIDKTGRLVIPITKPAGSFSEGFAMIEGLGYIDKTGKVVIKPH